MPIEDKNNIDAAEHNINDTRQLYKDFLSKRQTRLKNSLSEESSEESSKKVKGEIVQLKLELAKVTAQTYQPIANKINTVLNGYNSCVRLSVLKKLSDKFDLEVKDVETHVNLCLSDIDTIDSMAKGEKLTTDQSNALDIVKANQQLRDKFLYVPQDKVLACLDRIAVVEEKASKLEQIDQNVDKIKTYKTAVHLVNIESTEQGTLNDGSKSQLNKAAENLKGHLKADGKGLAILKSIGKFIFGALGKLGVKVNKEKRASESKWRYGLFASSENQDRMDCINNNLANELASTVSPKQ